MADEIFDFRWRFSESGYGLMEGFRGGIGDRRPGEPVYPELFVTDGAGFGDDRTYTAYQPLRTFPDLFLQFSALPTDAGSILQFANDHGLLTDEGIFTTRKDPLGISGEPLSYWKLQIEAMQEMVHVWTLQKQGSRDLSDYIRWKANGVHYRSRFRSMILAGTEDRVGWFKRWKHGELKAPALMAIQLVVNDYTTKQVGTRILWDRSGNSMSHYFVPKNLLGAMWLQFSLALVRDKKYRACQVCGAVMEISTDPHSQVRKRADAAVCSDRCRSQKQRDKRKAQKLIKSGHSLRSMRSQLVGQYEPKILKDWRPSR